MAQINVIVGDIDGNVKKIAEWMDRAIELQADVVTFPELALTGYPPEDLLLKPQFIDANMAAIGKLIARTRGITAVIGFVDKREDIYNAAAVVRDGELLNVYHKMFLPNYGVFDEFRYFQAGREAPVVRIGDATVGVSICEDIWYPDGPFVQQALSGGAEVLINISSSPYHAGKRKWRERMLGARAGDNTVIVAYNNLIGGQDELVFDGASMVVGSDGRLMARAKQFEEELLVCDMDAASNPLAPLLDETQEVYQALVAGTRDYVQKNGFSKVALGLSGGIDSSLVAVIAVDALGADNVIGISMPSRFNVKATRQDAKMVAGNLGIKCKEISIKRIHQIYLRVLAKHFKGLAPDITEENLQARIRGDILMAFSNKFGWLILTTGNKSEMAVGYCTLYGDMSGGFAPLKDIFKTRVYELARWRNSQQENHPIPKSVFLRAPTAELRPHQTDEESLGAYQQLDEVLDAYVQRHQSVGTIVKDSTQLAYVKKIVNLVDKNEYKRRQAPPGVKITGRAFGRDWRLPITNKYKE